MAFLYARTIRFQDTDAAGVVYFARVLSLCHEAYEASLQKTGIELKTFFSRGAIAVPITHTEATFRQPMMCGDRVTIQLLPQPTSTNGFAIDYTVSLEASEVAAIAKTRHLCINTATRQRAPLTPELTRWLQHWTVAAESPTDVAPPD